MRDSGNHLRRRSTATLTRSASNTTLCVAALLAISSQLVELRTEV